MWVEIIDKDTIADADRVYKYAWRLYKSKNGKDFDRIRVYNEREQWVVTQYVRSKQLREVPDKEVFVLLLKDKKIMKTIQDNLEERE